MSKQLLSLLLCALMAASTLPFGGPAGSSERPKSKVSAESLQENANTAVEDLNEICAQQDYCIGDIVYSDTHPLLRGKIVNAIPNGRDVLVELDESGEIQRGTIDYLANTKIGRCARKDEYCVGDFVYNNKEPAKRGQIAGVYGSNEELAVQYSEDSIWNWHRASLALTRGCANDERFCVGGRVRANRTSGNHRYGTIVGIYFSGETVAIAFDSGVWQWTTGKLTPWTETHSIHRSHSPNRPTHRPDTRKAQSTAPPQGATFDQPAAPCRIGEPHDESCSG